MLSGRGLPGPVVTLCVHGQGSSPCPAAARMGLWLLLAIPSFWGSSSQGAVQPSPASGGPALRALCSRPHLLGVQLSGVQPSPASGGPALRALCSPAGEVVVQDSSGLGLPGYQWRPAASPALLVVRRPWRRVGSGPLPLSMFAPLDCLFLMEILRQCRAKAVPTVKWPSGTRPDRKSVV